jgi:N-acetylglutamate synthase-like GNAT family acetyltransferase
MTASTFRVRRATVEDLEMLRALWASMRLPVAELEPRLTEFQLVEDAEGKVVGGIALQVTSNQGRLHSEGFTDFAVADTARDLLWTRVQTLAANHGILRLWTQEDTPFWSRLGFKPAAADDLKKLPANWNAKDSSWLTLQLKNEAAINAVEQELLIYMNAEKQSSARVVQKVRTLKTLATVVAIILAIFILGAAFYLVIKKPELLHPAR